MPSWTNATAAPTTRGVLRPGVTARTAALTRCFPVSPALDPYVERYWAVRWDRRDSPPFRSEVLSHPSVNLSLETGTGPRFGEAMPAVLLHGVVTRRFVVDLVGTGRVVAVKFRPGGFVALTGAQVARDRVSRVDRSTWLGLGATDDPAALLAALPHQDDGEVAARLDAALLAAAHEPSPGYVLLRRLLERMLVDRSLVRVDQVAEAAGTSPRSLQRLFAHHVGTGPKAVLARYRLQDAVAAIDAGGLADGDLAGLASSLGWFDQAHFCRDFREVVGTTPSAYLARSRADAEGLA